MLTHLLFESSMQLICSSVAYCLTIYISMLTHNSVQFINFFAFTTIVSNSHAIVNKLTTDTTQRKKNFSLLTVYETGDHHRGYDGLFTGLGIT